MQALGLQPELWSSIHIVHQAGAKDYGRVKKFYESLPTSGHREVLPYLNDMPRRLSWADLVICRAGASTVAEICAAGKAAIFIPFPYAADDHQRKNAEALVEAGAADMLLQADLSAESLIQKIESFRQVPGKVEAFQKKLKVFDKPQSGHEIARLLLGKDL